MEFDVGGEPLPGRRVTANYAYIDTEITDDPSGATTGNRLFGVPEHSGGLFTAYEIQEGPLAGFGAGGGVFASDDVEADNFESASLSSGCEQFDAAAFYRGEHLVVRLNVKNLTDEAVPDARQRGRSGRHRGPARAGSHDPRFGAPRALGQKFSRSRA